MKKLACFLLVLSMMINVCCLAETSYTFATEEGEADILQNEQQIVDDKLLEEYVDLFVSSNTWSFNVIPSFIKDPYIRNFGTTTHCLLRTEIKFSIGGMIRRVYLIYTPLTNVKVEDGKTILKDESKCVMIPSEYSYMSILKEHAKFVFYEGEEFSTNGTPYTYVVEELLRDQMIMHEENNPDKQIRFFRLDK